jgi:hypothetical protein
MWRKAVRAKRRKQSLERDGQGMEFGAMAWLIYDTPGRI